MNSSLASNKLACLLFLAFVSGCAPTSERLEPKPEYADTSAGDRALSVSLVPDDARWGEAEVWSGGAFLFERDKRKLPIIHVGIRISNTTSTGITANLADARIRVTDDHGDVVDGIAPLEIREVHIAPHERQSAEMHFGLPESVPPGRVDSFELTLPVVRGEKSLTMRVGFSEREPKVVYARDPFWGFPRRPFFPYGPYGW